MHIVPMPAPVCFVVIEEAGKFRRSMLQSTVVDLFNYVLIWCK